MSEDVIKMSTRLPKPLHARLKKEADDTGVYLNDVVIAHLNKAVDGVDAGANADYLAFLNARRDSPIFGEETILQELLRRVISIQMLSVGDLIAAMPKDQVEAILADQDAQTMALLDQRKAATKSE